MSERRSWLFLCPAAAWLISLCAGGAKTGAPLILAEVFLLAGLLVWCLEAREISCKTWMAPFTAFTLWLPVNLLSPAPPTDVLQGIVKIVSLAGFFFLVAQWDEKEQKFFTKSVLGAALVDAGFVIAQSAAKLPVIGLFPGNPNYSAGFLAAGVALSLTALLSDWKGHRSIKNRNLFHIINLFVCFYGLGIHQSRGAWLAVGVAGLYLIRRLWGGKTALLAAAAAILGVTSLPNINMVHLVKLTNGPAAFARPLIWKSTLHMIRDYPLTGWGIGHFEQGFQLHPVPTPDSLFQYEKSTAFAHCEGLQVAAEMGIPTLLFLAGTLFLLWKNSNDSMGTKASLLALLTQNAFDMTFHLPAMALLTAGLAGTVRNEESKSLKTSWVLVRLVPALLVASGLFLILTHRSSSTSDNSSDPWSWEERAQLLAERRPPGWYGQALWAYEWAKNLSPFHTAFYCEAGELSLTGGDAPRAREEFRQCLHLEPNALRAWKGLVLSYQMLHQNYEARKLENSLGSLFQEIDRKKRLVGGRLSNYAQYLLGLI